MNTKAFISAVWTSGKAAVASLLLGGLAVLLRCCAELYRRLEVGPGA